MQVSDIGRHTSKSIRAQKGRSFAETMAISRYRTMVCSSVEAITIRLLSRKRTSFVKFSTSISSRGSHSTGMPEVSVFGNRGVEPDGTLRHQSGCRPSWGKCKYGSHLLRLCVCHNRSGQDSGVLFYRISTILQPVTRSTNSSTNCQYRPLRIIILK